MKTPLAVIAGDIHFTPSTLDLASAVVVQAKAKAMTLGVPLILNGDTLDTKAVMRGECVNRLIFLLEDKTCKVYVNTGNHDKISEKSKDHTLNFLRPYAAVIDAPTWCEDIDSYIVPYDHDTEALTRWLGSCESGSRLIVHQGVHSASSGEYVHDKSALPKEAFADFRTIGSHYHKAQSIKCGPPRKGAVGLFSYVGSGYTLTFGEANDPAKGFQILYSDGTLEHVPTNLRKHIIVEALILDDNIIAYGADDKTPSPGDLIWVKLKGPKLSLDRLSKQDLKEKLHLHDENFKLDKIPTDSQKAPSFCDTKPQTNNEIMDLLIEGSAESANNKAQLKKLYREVMS